MITQSLGVVSGLNFDGAYVTIPTRGERPEGYTQLFRQGYFEGVWVLSPHGNVAEPLLPSIAYENYVNQFLGRIRGELDRHGIRLDMAVFLSLLGADKVVFGGPSSRGFGSQHYRFDRHSLLLPDVLIPAEVMPSRGMRPAYDLMCQSAGMVGSANYGEDGEWIARS